MRPMPDDPTRPLPSPTGPVAAPSPAVPTADGLATLERAQVSAARYRRASRSDATWRAYASDWRIFEAWCADRSLEALPASADTLVAFLAAEADRGRAPSTLRRRIAAVRLVHLGAGAAPPHQAIAVAELMRGVRRTVGGAPAKKAPALDADVRAMVDALDLGRTAGLRDRALLLVGFAGALRRSEIAAMRFEDLERRPEGVLVSIPRSKGDRDALGQSVAVPARPGSRHCPVEALDAWAARAGIATGAVFRKVSRGGRVGPSALNPASVSDVVKRAAARVDGLDPARYSAHSLRHGLLTSAARRGGADVFRLRAHSRHASLQTLLEYVEDGEAFERHAADGLLEDDGRPGGGRAGHGPDAV